MSQAANFSLLKTKLQIPTLRYPTIARPQLMARLQSDQAVIVLTAPIGSGKTTLLVEWAQWSSDAVAWLTLDELDNDPDRFLSLSDCGGRGEDRLEDYGDAPLEATMSAISTLLAQEPLTLVLDNYHVISNAAIHDAVTFLIDHLPPVLAPDNRRTNLSALPLVRLRVSGQLAQIDDLNFNRAEIAEYLLDDMRTQPTDPLRNTVSEALHLLAERTEGWIAGLRLAKLWLKSGADARGFGAAYRHVYDYFMQEVFHSPAGARCKIFC